MTIKALAHATTVTAIAIKTLGLRALAAGVRCVVAGGVVTASGYAAPPTRDWPKSVMAFLQRRMAEPARLAVRRIPPGDPFLYRFHVVVGSGPPEREHRDSELDLFG